MVPIIKKTQVYIALLSRVLLAALLGYALVSPLEAATKRWSGGAGTTDWNSDANWSPVGVPSASDDIVLDSSLINLPASMAVNGGNPAARTVTFASGFNSTSTTLIGGGSGQPAFLTVGGSGTGLNPLIQVNSTSGTVTFNKRNGGTADLGIILGAASSIYVNAGANLVVNCEMSGTSGFVKTGSGTMALGGASTFTGETTVSAGTLALLPGIGSVGSLSNSPTIWVYSGAVLDVSGVSFGLQGSQALAGNGVVNGSFSTLPGATVVAGPAGSAGTLTFNNNLTLNGSSVVFDLSTENGGTNDQIVVGGNLILSGNNVILLNYLSGSIQAGTYKIVKYTGTKTGNFTLGDSYPNVTLDQTTTPNYVTLIVGAGGSSIPNLTWKGDGVNNAWDLGSTANWLSGSTPSVYADPARVVFDDSGSTTPFINLSAAVNPTLVTMNSANNYTISGNGKISGTPWVANGLIVSGSGTLTLSTTNDFSGGINLLAGRLKVGTPLAIPSGAGKGDVLVSGTFDLNGHSTTVNGLFGLGTVDNGSGALTYTLTLGANGVGGNFSGVIKNTVGTVAVTKIGTGTVILGGNNTYAGATTVNAGTLQVNGALASGAVTVTSGGTLGGGGTIGGPVTVQSGGMLSPGSSIGTLTINNSLALSGATVMEINKAGAALTSDLVKGVTTLTYGGTLTVTATGDALAENDSFNLFDATTFAGSFGATNLPSLSSCLAWDTSKLAVDGTLRVTHETVPPVFGTTTATEVQSGTVNVKNCAASVFQGTVNLAVVASDNCALAGPPVVALTNGANTATAAFVNESPAGTFNYTWLVNSGTATGTWTATATATDTLGNTARTTFTLCVVQQFQVTGQVEMQSFAGTNRTLTFVATSSANTPLQTNDVVLTFTGSPVKLASYSINVPVNTANLSAKTAWTLRKKLAVTFSNGQAVLNFSSATRLLGGEITQDNRVNTTDNNIFKSFNGKLVSTTPAAAQADVNGDGRVNTSDYNILKSNLGKIGDAQ